MLISSILLISNEKHTYTEIIRSSKKWYVLLYLATLPFCHYHSIIFRCDSTRNHEVDSYETCKHWEHESTIKNKQFPPYNNRFIFVINSEDNNHYTCKNLVTIVSPLYIVLTFPSYSFIIILNFLLLINFIVCRLQRISWLIGRCDRINTAWEYESYKVATFEILLHE